MKKSSSFPTVEVGTHDNLYKNEKKKSSLFPTVEVGMHNSSLENEKNCGESNCFVGQIHR